MMEPMGSAERLLASGADAVLWGIGLVPVLTLPSSSGAWASLSSVISGASFFIPASALAWSVGAWSVYIGTWLGLAMWRWARTLGAP